VTLDGVGMLVNQAVIAIELWTGVAAEPGVLRSAYAEAVGT
jgi:shikimate 5-dehydrogenase